MTISNCTSYCDSDFATHRYEELRSNALGDTNRADDFILFLRNGMSLWLKRLAERCNVRQRKHEKVLSIFTDDDTETSEIGLASILTDAIINMTVIARK